MCSIQKRVSRLVGEVSEFLLRNIGEKQMTPAITCDQTLSHEQRDFTPDRLPGIPVAWLMEKVLEGIRS